MTVAIATTTMTANGRLRSQRSQDDRWNRARELNRMLYRGILNQDPRGDDDRRDDIDRIYSDGSLGLRQVALNLAREAQRDIPSRLSQDQAVRIMGALYRDLLGRDMSDRELWDRDRGFRGNVDTLRRGGLERIVDVIVGSEEFRSINKTVEFDRMPRDRDRRSGYRRYDDRVTAVIASRRARREAARLFRSDQITSSPRRRRLRSFRRRRRNRHHRSRLLRLGRLRSSRRRNRRPRTRRRPTARAGLRRLASAGR